MAAKPLRGIDKKLRGFEEQLGVKPRKIEREATCSLSLLAAHLPDPGPKRDRRAQGVRTVHDEREVRLETVQAAGCAEQPRHHPSRRREAQPDQAVPHEVVGRPGRAVPGEIRRGGERDERQRREAPGQEARIGDPRGDPHGEVVEKNPDARQISNFSGAGGTQGFAERQLCGGGVYPLLALVIGVIEE